MVRSRVWASLQEVILLGREDHSKGVRPLPTSQGELNTSSWAVGRPNPPAIEARVLQVFIVVLCFHFPPR